jgi:hypothetical protein
MEIRHDRHHGGLCCKIGINRMRKWLSDQQRPNPVSTRAGASHTSGVGGQSEPAALEPPCFCWPRGLGQVRMPVRAVNIIAAASASRCRWPARPMQQAGRATLAASNRLVRTCRKLPSSRSSLRFGWAEEGRRYRGAQHLGAAALVRRSFHILCLGWAGLSGGVRGMIFEGDNEDDPIHRAAPSRGRLPPAKSKQDSPPSAAREKMTKSTPRGLLCANPRKPYGL